MVRAVPDVATWGRLTIVQMRRVGVDSLPVALFIAAFTGVVLALQASYTFTGTVPLYFVGTLVGKTMMLELGPVLAGLALAGRVGASMAAELGTMKVTEQVDALETLAYDPQSFLVLPRVIAGTAMFPVIVALAILTGIVTGWLASVVLLDLSTQEFIKGLKLFYRFKDTWFGLFGERHERGAQPPRRPVAPRCRGRHRRPPRRFGSRPPSPHGAAARDRVRVPVRGPVRLDDRVGQPRPRPKAPRTRGGGDCRAGAGSARLGRPHRDGRALSRGAVGRDAQAGRDRPRDRAAAALRPLRRAHHGPRPRDLGRDGPLDGPDAGAPRRHGGRGHARHAERLHRGRPHRHAVRGPHPAGRHRRRDSSVGGSRREPVHRGTSRVKRENEFAVGLVVIAVLAGVVAGALWLSGGHLGKAEAVYTARFRTVGGLSVGDPVVLRGVRVGRGEGIRLAQGNWVEADLKISGGARAPPKPAVIAASASLFGEWAASLVPLDQLPNDPNVRQAIAEAVSAGGNKWPGATLPDIGQLTAQASRIATDIATVSSRIQSAFDSEAVLELRRSIKDFGQVANRIARVTNEQANVLGSVGQNLQQGSEVLAKAATNLQVTLGRVDSATNPGQLATIPNNSAATSTDLRAASQDFRELLDAAHKNHESLVRVLRSPDSRNARIANKTRTFGLLGADSDRKSVV